MLELNPVQLGLEASMLTNVQCCPRPLLGRKFIFLCLISFLDAQKMNKLEEQIFTKKEQVVRRFELSTSLTGDDYKTNTTAKKLDWLHFGRCFRENWLT